MMMSDISAATLSADGEGVAGPARVKSIYYLRGTTAGSLVLRDGGTSGDILLSLTVPAAGSGEDSSNYLSLPGNGLRFTRSVYVDVTNLTSVTLFYS